MDLNSLWGKEDLKMALHGIFPISNNSILYVHKPQNNFSVDGHPYRTVVPQDYNGAENSYHLVMGGHRKVKVQCITVLCCLSLSIVVLLVRNAWGPSPGP